MEAIYITMVAYVVVFFGTIILLNFLTKGFLFTHLRVWISRGKLILVQVRSPLQNYWITGKIAGTSLYVRDREAVKEKTEKTLILSENVVTRVFGVNCVYYDEATNELLRPDLSNVAGFDAIKITNLITRALMKPQNEQDEMFRKIVFIALGILVLGLFLIYFKLTGIEKAIAGLSSGGVINGFIGFQNWKK